MHNKDYDPQIEKIAPHLRGMGSSPIHVFAGECNKLLAEGKPVINSTIGNPGHPMEQVARQAAKSLLDYPVARNAFLTIINDKSATLNRAQYKALREFLKFPEQLNYFAQPRTLSSAAKEDALHYFKMHKNEQGTEYKLYSDKTIRFETIDELKRYFDQEKAQNISYSPIRGYPQVLKSAARYMNFVYGCNENDPKRFKAENMAMTSSATTAFNAVAEATIAPGDVFFLIAPYYPTYGNVAKRLQANLVVIPTLEENGFVPTNEAIEEAFTKAAEKFGADKIKHLFTNYPNNPTGATLNEAQATQMAKKIDELVKRYPNMSVSLDDVYVDVTVADHTPIRNKLSPESMQNIVTLYTGAKSMALAGERIAVWETANKQIAQKMSAIASGLSMNSPTMGQVMFASTADYWVDNPKEQRKASQFYASNTELFSKEITRRIAKYSEYLPEYTVPFQKIARATLYTFPNLDAFLGLPILDGFEQDKRIKGSHISDSSDFIFSMLQMHKKGEYAVGGIPAIHYGAGKDNIRFSLPFASHDSLYKALDSFEKLLELSIEKVKTQLQDKNIEPTAQNVRDHIKQQKDLILQQREQVVINNNKWANKIEHDKSLNNGRSL